jgi:hypothetical protein
VDLWSALNSVEDPLMPDAKADALSRRDASDWEEAVDWGVPDCSTSRAHANATFGVDACARMLRSTNSEGMIDE